jgi:HAD superfamily hydrolase (TIGR01509 family)
VRRTFVEESGGHWQPDSQRRLMGMSTTEWASYLHSDLAVPLSADRIINAVLERMQARYAETLPLVDGTVKVVQSLARGFDLGIASSSPRLLLDFVLNGAGLAAEFRAAVSSDEVARGKPAPDVYLEAARRLEVDPADCAAVEDSSNGLRSAASAGMRVIVIPNRRYPPDAKALSLAGVTLNQLRDLTPEVVQSLRGSQ